MAPSAGGSESGSWAGGAVGFVVMATSISWALWAVAAVRPGTWDGNLAQVAGTFGPTVAAVVMLRRQGGWPAVRRSLARTVRLRGAMMTTVIGIVLPPVIAAAGWWLDRLLGGGPPIAWPPPGMVVAIIVYVLVLGGPLGEEMGWRGFLLPRLEHRLGPVVGTMLVAAIWAVWHLPLFALEDTVQTVVPIWLFAAQILVTSVVYTWLLHRSPMSLVPSMAFHTSFNVSVGLVLLSSAEDPAVRPMVLAVVVAGLVAAALAATPTFWRIGEVQ